MRDGAFVVDFHLAQLRMCFLFRSRVLLRQYKTPIHKTSNEKRKAEVYVGFKKFGIHLKLVLNAPIFT